VSVGGSTVVLDILPVVEVRVLLKFIQGPNLLGAGLPLDELPALRVVVHQRIAHTGLEASQWKPHKVGGVLLALSECRSVGRSVVKGRHCSLGILSIYLGTLDPF